MPNLIERIEAATGADREIDLAIAECLGWHFRLDQCDDDMTEETWIQPDGKERADLPRWTDSIDAAIVLVPKGSFTSLVGPAGCTYSARVDGEVGLAQSFSLALCAAALKARGKP